MKKKIVVAGLIISLLAIVVAFAVSRINKSYKENDEYSVLYDAKEMLRSADNQLYLDELKGNKKTTCLYIYGWDGLYRNSGNYRGHIDLSKEEPYIELSDGKYFVRGTYYDLKLLKSNLEASTSCN